MSDDFLGGREKALENQFFARKNAELIEKLRAGEVTDPERIAAMRPALAAAGTYTTTGNPARAPLQARARP